ncbi:sigma factor-like helix-turn-helix DNA-binding protein [Marinobacter sp.]|uniref:sigma factor-like helix-turn-helix DNA-binding protein n=1 Tax=Marinobacter sp. TaxID=50741 RepID=UPI003A9267F6
MLLLENQWAREREVENLKATVADYRHQIDSAKSDILTTVSDMRLNRREPPPPMTEELYDSVTDWIERARAIRKASKLAYLDGSDLDVPDVDIPEDELNLRPCYPCKVHKVVQEVLSEMRPEYRDVLRVRFCLRSNERYSFTPGFIPYQWYVAQQLGVSQTTVSRLLKRAIRSLRHPYRSGRLIELVGEFDVNNVQCPAEYMIVKVVGLRM